VKLPRVEQTTVEPPSAQEVETIIATVPPRWRLPLRVLEQTGLRIGELHALESAGCRRDRKPVPCVALSHAGAAFLLQISGSQLLQSENVANIAG
jgi:hypothetical protein